MLKSIMLGTMLVASTCFATAHARGSAPGPMFSQADKDGGTLSREAFRDSRAAKFARMDRNSDGYLDEADRRDTANAPKANAKNGEWPARRMKGERTQRNYKKMDRKDMLERLDADGDGRISKDEFIDGAMPMFDKADTDGNGVLDAKELATMRQSAWQHFQEQRQQRGKAQPAAAN